MAPVSHTAWIVVTSGRDVAPSRPTWSPGPTPRAWQRGRDGLGVLVQAAPRHHVGVPAGGRAHERQPARRARGLLEAGDDGRHPWFDPARRGRVTGPVPHGHEGGMAPEPGATAAAGSWKNRERASTRSAPAAWAAASVASSTWAP